MVEEQPAEPLKEFGPWREVKSSTGRTYYYNQENEVSQWDKPEEWRLHEQSLEAKRLAALEAERQRQQPHPIPPPQPPPPPFPMAFYNMPPGAGQAFPFTPNAMQPPFNMAHYPPMVPPVLPPPRLLQPSPGQRPAPSPARTGQKIPLLSTPPQPIGLQGIPKPGLLGSGETHGYQPHMSQRPPPPLIRPPVTPVSTTPFRPPTTNVSSRFDRPEASQKPHPYGTPQALPHHAAPHPYRRDDPLRRSQDSFPDAPKKREGEPLPGEGDLKRPPVPPQELVVEEREESVEVQMEDVEPQQPQQHADEEPYQVHLTAEAREDAAIRSKELNLAPEVPDRATDQRLQFYGNLNKRATAIGKSVQNKTMEDITKHRLELSDMKQRGMKERREAVDKKPVQCFVFESPDERADWLNQRAAERNQRIAAKKAKWSEQKACREALMASFKDFHIDKDRQLEEVNRKVRDEVTQRLELNEQEKIKLFTEMAAEAEEQAREEHKKAETAARRARRSAGGPDKEKD